MSLTQSSREVIKFTRVTNSNTQKTNSTIEMQRPMFLKAFLVFFLFLVLMKFNIDGNVSFLYCDGVRSLASFYCYSI